MTDTPAGFTDLRILRRQQQVGKSTALTVIIGRPFGDRQQDRRVSRLSGDRARRRRRPPNKPLGCARYTGVSCKPRERARAARSGGSLPPRSRRVQARARRSLPATPQARHAAAAPTPAASHRPPAPADRRSWGNSAGAVIKTPACGV